MKKFFKNNFVILCAAIVTALLFSGCNRFSTRDIWTPENVTVGNPNQPTPPHENCNVATLSWDKNAGPNLVGYKVYIGLRSGMYGTQIDVGPGTQDPADTNRIQYKVTGLESTNTTYYFAVTAYNSSDIESSKSNEVSKTFTNCAQ